VDTLTILNIDLRLNIDKMTKYLLVAFFLFVCTPLIVYGQNQHKNPQYKITPEMTEQWFPKLKVITPGHAKSDGMVTPPSDAIILFGGSHPNLSKWIAAPDSQVLLQQGKLKDMSKFQSTAGEKKADWTVSDGILTVNKKAGDIETKKAFRDFQLHIEWRIPKGIHGKGQYKGNSGIFLQGMYELQVLDSYHNRTYVNGQAGSIYKQTPPLVNAMRSPGQWNKYDIIFTAPTFSAQDSSYRTFPRITVFLNGVLVQNNTIILGTTNFVGVPQVAPHRKGVLIGKGPIRLQAHNDPSKPISYRNIWIRKL
jgi:hypothetical protein